MNVLHVPEQDVLKHLRKSRSAGTALAPLIKSDNYSL